MFLIPSVWPETFSYTTSEIISMGFPVAVLPVGAPVERVKRYARGLVLKDEQPENIVEEMILCGKLSAEVNSLWKTQASFCRRGDFLCFQISCGAFPGAADP